MRQMTLTRRLLLSAAGAALVAGMLIQPASAQTPPGVLIVGQIAEPKALDPQAVTAANDFRIIVNLFDGLVRFRDGTLEVEPALADSWQISEDGKTYRFSLRPGVMFHDGTPVDAEAVKFTFDRMLREDHPYYSTGPFPLAFFFSSVASVEAPDAQTVVFTLTEPYAPFLTNLATPTGAIVSPTAVAAHGADFGRNPVGAGAFKFAEWRSNEAVVVEANPDYWDGAPGLQAVVFRPITDANTRTAEMLAGGIDVMTEVPPVSLGQFGAGYHIVEAAGPHVWFLILNLRDGVFSDQRVRQAVNYAVNKEAIVNDVLEGTATVAEGPIPAAFGWAYNPEVKPYPHDPDKARELLAEAGIAPGTKLRFMVTEGGSGMLDPVAMATAIQADLAAVGLQAEIQSYEWNTFLGEVNPGLAGKGDMAEMAWMTSDPDTLPFLTLRTEAFPDKGGFNSGYYSNPEVDALLEQARVATDQAVRAEAYRKVQQIVHDDAPWLFVANWKQNAVTSDRVTDFTLQPSFLLDLHKVGKN